MSDPTPKTGPNASDSPEVTPENSKVFGYDVSQQAKQPRAEAPNTNSPLAAG